MDAEAKIQDKAQLVAAGAVLDLVLEDIASARIAATKKNISVLCRVIIKNAQNVRRRLRG